MESNYHHFPSSLSRISTLKKPLLLRITILNTSLSSSSGRRCYSVRNTMSSSGQQEASAFSYKKFIHFALEETRNHACLNPSPLQENFSHSVAMDGKTELKMLSYEAPKIRLLRSLCIEQSDGLQVLDLGIFPRPEFDLPIFCANFFTTATMNIIVLDLNPLHDVINRRDYKEKYYNHLIPLGLKYAELLPWGGKITSESLRFFSPIVIWTKFSPNESKQNALYCAFKEYLKAWLELMDEATEESTRPQIMCNLEAQHRYLTWRAEKDPGHQVLTRLIGETRAKETIRNFLFNGVDELGSKTFIDYFPEYECEDGTINKKRSVIGKSFESRPWDSRGEFIGDKYG